MLKKNEIEKPDTYLDLIAKKAKEYLYHDHPSEGIDFFCDDEVEDIGWNASAFEFITYRDIAEFIEENCEGTLTFNDHPMGFNGFVEVDNIEDVREKVKQFVMDKIKQNPLEEYDEDQQEALNFFNIKL